MLFGVYEYVHCSLLSSGGNLVSDSRLSFGRQSHQSLLVGEIFLLAGKWSLYSILARTGDLQLYCLLAEIHKLFLLATKHLLLLTFECWIFIGGYKVLILIGGETVSISISGENPVFLWVGSIPVILLVRIIPLFLLAWR